MLAVCVQFVYWMFGPVCVQFVLRLAVFLLGLLWVLILQCIGWCVDYVVRFVGLGRREIMVIV